MFQPRQLQQRLGRLCWRIWMIVALMPTLSLADDWPQWRGPRLNGISTETGLPTAWNQTDNVVWRVALPGPAGSSPVVASDRVFVTSPDGQAIKLICISTDGKPQWSHQFGTGNLTVRQDEGNSASPSPITDGRNVWRWMATAISSASRLTASRFGPKTYNRSTERSTSSLG